MPSDPVDSHIENLEATFRQVHGQAVATLARVFGDISLAEDAVQDAFVRAGRRWPVDGTPANPAGWIITTARNRAIDLGRRATRGRELNDQLRVEARTTSDPTESQDDQGPVADDQLRLIFTCCHPALKFEHRVALTLRLLGGLDVEEIARSFLVSESTMAKRLVRAKYKIKAAGIPYRIPAPDDLPGRLHAVLAVIYLIFNAGADDDRRSTLRADAIRLGRSLSDLLPDQPEVSGLLALMLLVEARMPARAVDGSSVLLRDQDRTQWDRALISEGHQIVHSCIRRNRPGPYQVQAAIQAVHCQALTYEETAWDQILTLYDQLFQMTPTPVVALNRAIAVGEVDGPEPALRVLDAIEPQLQGYHLFHATRGSLLSRLGRDSEAHAAFETALRFAELPADLAVLEQRAGY